MKYAKVQEETLKNKVARDFFGHFDCTEIVEKIDFTVKTKGHHYLLWAEAKAAQTDVCEMLAQLVLTIGKARTFDKITPPPFLGCFDREKIAFVPYHAVQEIFYQNDFNWNITPSKRDTSEFKQVYALIKKILYGDSVASSVIPARAGIQTKDSNPVSLDPRLRGGDIPYIFDFETNENELKQFIQTNFIVGKSDISKTRLDKNNFINIYNRWLDAVKPTIAVDWEQAKKSNILDGDFYLADLLSRENKTLKEKLFVLLKSNYYEVVKGFDTAGFLDKKKADFKDNQKAHLQFWAIYERPPLEEYWDYIINRRDLLVPQDVRERKGSFFTPRIWVELSQKYLADVFGENWQDEYYVWDCAAGTGNLLAGLTNKYNVWASTLDKADVDVMHDRILNGANLLEEHVFQFDFLNDDFSKLPKGLQDIINDPNERKKLIVYINPPYAETMSYGVKHKAGLNQSMVNKKYINKMGNCANRELFVQFLSRIYCEIPTCKIAHFSKMKILTAPNFASFRTMLQANLEKLFVVPSNSFDNVRGKFPIGFFIWNTEKQEKFKKVTATVFDQTGNKVGKKKFFCYDGNKSINEWIITTRNRESEHNIGFISCLGNDFQTQNIVFVMNDKKQMAAPRGSWITNRNLIEVSIYFTVRKVISATWLNDRDQFLYPNKKWTNDIEFQNDCLAYTLFNNNIQSKYGANHWIPFLESEINARDKFDSHFMMSFISGKLIQNRYVNLFEQDGDESFIKREFSQEAQAVFAAGRELWRYYHAQPKCNVNASLYDIREHFQGRNAQGKMNNKSDDETYNGLIADLRSALKTLAEKIEPKVYEYGFLKK